MYKGQYGDSVAEYDRQYEEIVAGKHKEVNTWPLWCSRKYLNLIYKTLTMGSKTSVILFSPKILVCG